MIRTSIDETDVMLVRGGAKLSGRVVVSGSKNASLPIMASTILCEGLTKLENLPLVNDVLNLKCVLEKLGAQATISIDGQASIDASTIWNHSINPEDSKKMRASVLVAGPLLARFGEAVVAQLGGCVIGGRPIDLHLKGFQALGATISPMSNGLIRISASQLHGERIDLPFPSMGATENLMMAACLAKGKTIINNAAREPEIVDLANFLRSMGAVVLGAGSSSIRIEGVRRLSPSKYKIIPDRIEAGTYILAGAITGGEILVENIIADHLSRLIEVLQIMGVNFVIYPEKKTVVVQSHKKLRSTNVVALPFPGFPTDLHPILVTLLTVSKGVSTITDTVFPQRFCYTSELKKMGARISVSGNSAKVRSVPALFGTNVYTTDLRGGAALVLAGLVANGVTTLRNCSLIHRGYENMNTKLQRLGADVETVCSNDDLLAHFYSEEVREV